jgi:outer membrane protein assembly factor BamB
MKKTFFLLGIALLIGAAFVSATDWPQYLGPDRNGISKETGIKRSWPEGGPEVRWTIPLGEGYGGAAVSKGKVYVLDRNGDDGDIFRVLDVKTGKEDWSYSYTAPGKLDRGGSRSVPAVDGNSVYTCGPFGHYHCFDIRSRKPLWGGNIWTDYSSDGLPRWGIAQNPLIYKDMMIMASQTKNAGVVAFDKKTGKVRWETPALPGRAGYVSPKIVTLGGEKHLVMISANGAVIGMVPETGKELWSYSGWQCRIPVPNVTEIGDGRIFITGGYRAGSAMIKLEKKSGVWVAAELFKNSEFGTHVHPAILHEGHLYGHCSTNETRDGMMCMSLEGEVKWNTGRSPLFDKGGFILVDGLFLSVDGDKGWLYLIEPDASGFKQLAKAKLLDTNTCWAPLTLTDGRLIIRDQKQMRCIAVK